MFQANVAEEIKRHTLCSETFSLENRVVYDMWKNTVQQDRPQIIVWRMHIACWIPRDTNTHTQNMQKYCFSTATMVTRTRFNVTFRRTLPELILLLSTM